MSKREFKRRNTPVERRTICSSRPPSSASSETRHRNINQWAGGNPWRPLINARVLRSTKSEPMFDQQLCWNRPSMYPAYDQKRCRSEDSDNFRTKSEYNRETKVVVNVTVEGSPGAVGLVVKLGSNVAEIIKLVINKYNQEKRTPYLHNATPSNYELHPSYFSLHSLRNSDLLGDIGSRSFYLRKSSDNGSQTEDVFTSSDQRSLSFLPSSISQMITRIIQGTRKFWKIFGCIR